MINTIMVDHHCRRPDALAAKMNKEFGHVIYIARNHDSGSHMWNSSTLAHYLNFLKEDWYATILPYCFLFVDATLQYNSVQQRTMHLIVPRLDEFIQFILDWVSYRFNKFNIWVVLYCSVAPAALEQTQSNAILVQTYCMQMQIEYDAIQPSTLQNKLQ